MHNMNTYNTYHEFLAAALKLQIDQPITLKTPDGDYTLNNEKERDEFLEDKIFLNDFVKTLCKEAIQAFQSEQGNHVEIQSQISNQIIGLAEANLFKHWKTTDEQFRAAFEAGQLKDYPIIVKEEDKTKVIFSAAYAQAYVENLEEKKYNNWKQS